MSAQVTAIASDPPRTAGGRATPEQVLAAIVDGINTGNLDTLLTLYESDAAFARRRPLQRRIVMDHDRAVLGHSRIDFQQGKGVRERVLERRDAIFRIAGQRSAAMSADQPQGLPAVVQNALQALRRLGVDPQQRPICGPRRLLRVRRPGDA